VIKYPHLVRGYFFIYSQLLDVGGLIVEDIEIKVVNTRC